MTHAPADPPWLDRSAYPFAPHFFETPHGRMHYVDEGDGPPVLLVHGTPTWSFLWRRFITELSRTHRVVAPDHLGFGLSDKPAEAPYRPEDHARRLTDLIDDLGLRDVALVVHDFGGPIGLSYTLEHAENVRALALFNTWMWSKASDRMTRWTSRLLGGVFGRILYTRLNFSPRVLLPALYGHRSKLTPEIHRHYVRVFPNPPSRVAPWVFARELVGSSAWYDDLWARRNRLAGKPALILWGKKDSAFGATDLARWQEALPDADTRIFTEAGHFVQEEEPEAATRTVADFVRGVDREPDTS